MIKGNLQQIRKQQQKNQYFLFRSHSVCFFHIGSIVPDVFDLVIGENTAENQENTREDKLNAHYNLWEQFLFENGEFDMEIGKGSEKFRVSVKRREKNLEGNGMEISLLMNSQYNKEIRKRDGSRSECILLSLPQQATRPQPHRIRIEGRTFGCKHQRSY